MDDPIIRTVHGVAPEIEMLILLRAEDAVDAVVFTNNRQCPAAHRSSGPCLPLRKPRRTK